MYNRSEPKEPVCLDSLVNVNFTRKSRLGLRCLHIYLRCLLKANMQRDLVKMCKVQMMRAFVNQRLTAAAEEIFELFERTIAEYEEQLHLSKEKQRNLLDDHRHDVRLQVSEEQEELWSSQEGEDFNPDSHLQTVYLDETSHLSGSDTDDSGDWERSNEPQEGLNPLQNKDLPVSDMNCNTGNTSVSSSECVTSFGQKEQLQKNKEIHTREKPFSCLVCGKRYQRKKPLNNHMIRHSVETPLSCSICKRSFIRKSEMVTHMRVHSGEKPFSCSVCGKMFSRHENLKRHYVVHTEEKLFGCSVCGKRFSQHGQLRRHSVVHTGEKPFGCSVCGERFALNENLKRHSICHSMEKSFSCSVCKRSFIWRTEMVRHMRIHTGEKPFKVSWDKKDFIILILKVPTID
uniref:C2H2-type domain-containing protein n=1 Tax=Labrus bergylta TaxID=56723 RepID=A0A3Q3F461_9LABR